MQRVLLTGANGGIGSATVLKLRESGNEVIEVTRKDADLTSLSDIQALGKKVEDTSLDWVVFAHGYIDINNIFLQQKPEEIEKTFQLNTLSLIYLSQIFLPRLSKSGGIIFVSSTAALTSNPGFPVYAASKAAVHTFAKALARGNLEHLFFSVCPAATNTPMREKIADDAAQSQPPSAVAEVIDKIISGTSGFTSGDIIVIKDSVVSVEPKKT